jgi:long-subunit acyl-CoA synthetase (AMP-forming)
LVVGVLSSDRSNLERRDLRFFCRVPEIWEQFQETTLDQTQKNPILGRI